MIYFMEIASDEWKAEDTRLLKYVSRERERKVLKYINLIDRKLSLYAALMARRGISLLINKQTSDLVFIQQPNRKPVLMSDKRVDFNISHTRNAILCAISLIGNVGVDIEKISLPNTDIMDYCFHNEEIEYVVAAEKERAIRFFEVWTRKEAYMKKLGLGISDALCGINTFSTEIISQTHTWRQGEYVCTVCGDIANIQEEIEQISQEELYSFFN